MVENEWLIILGVCVCVLSHAKTATNRKPDCTVKRSHLRYLICGVHVRPRLDQNLQRFDCEVSGIVSGRYVYDENVSRHNKMDEKSPRENIRSLIVVMLTKYSPFPQSAAMCNCQRCESRRERSYNANEHVNKD